MPATLLAPLLLLAPPADGAPDLSYTARRLDGPAVRLELSLRGEEDGSSRFAVAPGWGGVEDVAALLHGLRFEGPDGPLAARRDGGAAWEVEHPPGAALRASWELRPLPPSAPDTGGNEYRPLVTDALFHAIGSTCLLWPAWLEEAGELDVEWTWAGFREAGWEAACSHGTGAGPLRVRRSLPAFRHAVFYAGRGLRVHERDLGGRRLAVAVGGDGWAFADAEFVDLAERIVRGQRDFFGDPGPPLYVLTLLPTPRQPQGSFSLGGTGLTDSFALFVMDGIGLAEGSDERLRVARVLAHEHFHSWNGGLLAPRDPEQLGYWFSEGFTEFYTGRLLLAAGLITPEQRVAGVNEMLRAWWTSPVRNAPAARVLADFWNDADVQRLPYQRGELAAMLLDHALRRRSGGTQSLDDLLRELVAEARAGGPEAGRYDTASLLERFARRAGPEAAAAVRAVVEQGADAVLPADLWAPWVEVGTREVPAHELGFDREATVAGGRVAVPELRLREPGLF